jgi:hypothetical protein
MDRALLLKPSVLIVALAASFGLLPVTQAGAATVTIDGDPLNVYVSDAGNLQAKLDSDTSRVFYPPNDDDGNAGLFVGVSAGPAVGVVFGPPDSGAQYATTDEYTPVSQSAVSGAGTEGDPYTVDTVYKARSGITDYATVSQRVQYVQGAKQFSVGYTLLNVTSPVAPFQFRATSGADLYLEGDDTGTGLLDPGPPRFLAGVNNSVGRAGGMVEVPGSEWDAYQVTSFDDLWNSLNQPGGPALDNTLVSDVVDNGAGAQWNGYYGPGQGLAGGASVKFDVIWRFSSVVPLTLDPPEGTQSAGRSYKLTAKATQVTGDPLVGNTVRYSVTGANSASGVAAAATDSSGKAEVSYVGNNMGDDTVTVYVDLNNNGSRETNEPQTNAKVTWTQYKPPPPPASASIVVRGPFTVSKDGKVEVFLTCPSTAPAESGCEGDLTGRLSVRKHAPHKSKKGKSKKAGKHARSTKKKKKKPKPFKPGTRKYGFGPAHYKLGAKQNGKVDVPVNPGALKRLKKMKHGIVSFTVRTPGKAPRSAIGTIRMAR